MILKKGRKCPCVSKNDLSNRKTLVGLLGLGILATRRVLQPQTAEWMKPKYYFMWFPSYCMQRLNHLSPVILRNMWKQVHHLDDLSFQKLKIIVYNRQRLSGIECLIDGVLRFFHNLVTKKGWYFFSDDSKVGPCTFLHVPVYTRLWWSLFSNMSS